MSVDREKLRKSLEARFGKREEPKRKLPWRLAVGIIITVVAFFIILFGLNSLLAWPDSILTLGGMLVISWFGSIIAGEHIATPRLSTIAATVLALGVAASTLGLGMPWKVEIFPSAQEFENFGYRARFIYLGDDDNTPLENLLLSFPAPKIDNKIAVTQQNIYQGWELYYLEEDNTLTLEATNNQIYDLRGERNSTIGILLSVVELETEYGPLITYNIDRLYPREIFGIIAIVSQIPKNRADDVTLRTQDGNTICYWHTPIHEAQENKIIAFQFSVALYQEINPENFENSSLVEMYEDAGEGIWGAYSIPKI